MSDPTRISKLLERLIIDMIPANTSEKTLQDYYKYFHRILTSRISSLDQDESSLKTLITQKIFSIATESNTQKHTANSTALRVQELLQNLSKTRILFQKNSILYLIYKLANTGKTGKITSGPIEALFRANEEIKRPMKPQQNLQNNNSMDIEKSLNPDHRANESFLVQTIKKVTNKGNDSINLKEIDILRDILYVFHAIDGHYINFNDQENAYAIKSGIPLSEPLRTLINGLCEIGFLYKQLNNFLSKPQPGLIRQAFAISLKEELNEYFKLLALLENLRIETEETDNQSLSLRKLALWIIEPLERLKWLNIMSDGINELIGGDVLSSLYSYKTQGSPVVMQLINRILINVNQPFLKHVHQWMYQGIINDPIGEFFVSELENETNIWVSKYKLVLNKIPSFLSETLAEKIYLAGKTVIFLKKCCNIKEWMLNIETFDSKDLSQITKFTDWVLLCSSLINQKLLEVLFLNFNLEKHLDFLKKYLLMGQGDLIQNLMDNLTVELNKPASQIYRHQLMGYLEGSIRASNAQYHSPEFVNRLEIKLLEASPGDTGWDIFSLDYRVESPLNTIFHSGIMRKYLRIFNFLWRVKRVEFCLNTVWINHMKASQYLGKASGFMKEFHKCHLLRNEMIHFIDNLFNYLMVEVIEGTWDQFKEKLGTMKELNELIKTHENCIDKILEKALLKEKTEGIYKHLLKIFELIYRLKFTQEILLNKAHESYSIYQQKKREKEIEELIGEDKNTEERTNEMKIGFMNENTQILNGISNDYMEALFTFQNLLKKEENIGNLKFLSFRLDFNEYYNNQPNNKFSNMAGFLQGKNFVGFAETPLDAQYKDLKEKNFKNDQYLQTGQNISTNMQNFSNMGNVRNTQIVQNFQNIQNIQNTTDFKNLQKGQNMSNVQNISNIQIKQNLVQNSQINQNLVQNNQINQNLQNFQNFQKNQNIMKNIPNIPNIVNVQNVPNITNQRNMTFLDEIQNKKPWLEEPPFHKEIASLGQGIKESKPIIESIFKHDMEEEEDEFLQEGEDEDLDDEGNELSFDPDKTNSFRK